MKAYVFFFGFIEICFKKIVFMLSMTDDCCCLKYQSN